jgi:hypothetical protein
MTNDEWMKAAAEILATYVDEDLRREATDTFLHELQTAREIGQQEGREEAGVAERERNLALHRSYYERLSRLVDRIEEVCNE